MQSYFQTAANQAQKLASALTGSASSAGRSINPDMNLPNYGPGRGSNGGETGGGYNCSTDGAAIAFTGLAFTVIGLMAGPFGVLGMELWAGFSLWGGVAATGWGMGHAIAGCGF